MWEGGRGKYVASPSGRLDSGTPGAGLVVGVWTAADGILVCIITIHGHTHLETCYY